MRRILLTLGVILAVLIGPTPTNAATATVRDTPKTTFNVTAWNERSFPVMARYKYRHDLLGTTSGWAKAPATVVLGAEFHASTNLDIAMRYVRQHGLVHRGTHGDAVQFFTPRKGLHLGSSTDRLYHRSCGPHSPARNYVATRARIDGFPVKFVALHLSQMKYRLCQAQETSWLKAHVIASGLAHGRTVIIGGDLNKFGRGYFWHRGQVAIHSQDLMQIAVIPAKGVTPHIRLVNVLSRLNPKGLWTDHLTPRAKVTLTR